MRFCIKKTGTRRCPSKKALAGVARVAIKFQVTGSAPPIPLFDPLSVQAEVEAFPLLFLVDAQADREVNRLEDDVASDPAN